MKLSTKLGITVVMTSLTACASGPRKVSMVEIMTLENQVTTAAKNQSVPLQPENFYAQPVNKSESCKLLVRKDQLERKNFRTYWDGDCKDGYAYGLGREIALSDTHHVEKITIQNGDGDSSGQPSRVIDYVKNFGSYGVNRATFPTFSGYTEQITNNHTGFSIQYRAGASDNKGSRLYQESSPFDPVKATFNTSHGNPDYILFDYSELPNTSDGVQMILAAADPITLNPLGFQVVSRRNGMIQHQQVKANSTKISGLVQLPPEYIAQLLEKIGEAQSAVQQSAIDAAKAQQMEREYLYMACAADYSIKGMPPKDMEIARKICTWRDQWKEPYAMAETRYKEEMERKQQKVAQAEQQRAYIVAQQAQAAAAQSAAFAASMTQLNQSLQQQHNTTMQRTNQMIQQLQYQNNQMMNSWTSQQNKTMFCQTVGSHILCR